MPSVHISIYHWILCLQQILASCCICFVTAIHIQFPVYWATVSLRIDLILNKIKPNQIDYVWIPSVDFELIVCLHRISEVFEIWKQMNFNAFSSLFTVYSCEQFNCAFIQCCGLQIRKQIACDPILFCIYNIFQSKSIPCRRSKKSIVIG